MVVGPFFSSVPEGNSDVFAFLSVGRNDAKNIRIDIEQHSFMLVLLKVLTTKGESRLMPPSQMEQVTSYLKLYEKDFAENAQKALSKGHLGGKDKDYINAVESYAQSAYKLLTPVNVWMIPFPNGHNAILASPNRLSLALSAGS